MSEPRPKGDIRNWWTENPMTYGSRHGTTRYDSDGAEHCVALGTREFFEDVDKTFYSWNRPLHNADGYFAKIFPYENYRGKDIIEIGCGMGTMAMNWALHGARVHAVDLNSTSVQQTAARFKLRGLHGGIVQADAHTIPFPDASFDYAYSWGVLHHSPHLHRSIEEMFRVLRPGGGFGVMLYNRDSLLYWYTIRYFEGFLHRETRFLTPLQLASRYTDGDTMEGNPHTWPVTKAEMRALFGRFSCNVAIQVLGTDLDFMLSQVLPVPGMSKAVPRFLLKPWARRWGWSLWITGEKLAPSRATET